VTELIERLRANASKRDTLSRERDDLIREAKAAGVPVTHIAEAIGLTRQQVHRILAEVHN
jgi:DNA invertase Pin-like site-specific DNA recombinase